MNTFHTTPFDRKRFAITGYNTFVQGGRILLILLIFTGLAYSKTKTIVSAKESAGTTSSAYTAPVDELANPGCGPGASSALPISSTTSINESAVCSREDAGIIEDILRLNMPSQVALLIVQILTGVIGVLIGVGLGVWFARRSGNNNSGKPYVTVNGVKITTRQFNQRFSNAISEGGEDTPQLRQAILNDLIMREAVSQDLKRSGLIGKDKNIFQLEEAREKAMLDLWFAQYFKVHPLTDADVRAEYEKQTAASKDAKNAQEYLLSQIVVGSETEAIDIVNQLNSGIAFETLAKEKSLDKDSGAQGGLLGWALPTQITSPIDEAIVSMMAGQVTKPIQTKAGWHIVKVNNTQPRAVPDFEHVKIGIAQKMAEDKRQQAIAELMSTVKVVGPKP